MKFSAAFVASFVAYSSLVSAVPVIKRQGTQTVTIKAGDTCNTIAKAIGTTVQDIFSNNPEVNGKCTNLKIGASLKVTAVKGNAAGNKQTPTVDSTAAAQCNTTAPAQQNNGIAGAVYFMTNEAKGNFLVASAIGADGKITPTEAVYTGGKGGHGQAAGGGAPGPDPLFTQDSVKVGGEFVFVVNAGSNSLSMFKINTAKPTDVRLVGMPVNTQGEFPVAVAFSKKMNMACVVNGGAADGVACFKVDKNKGLVPVANTNRKLNLKQTTPPTGPPNTVSDIIFNEDETKLLVSVKGIPPTPGRISSFDVNPKDGSLSAKSVDSTPSKGGVVPFSMTNIPGKNAVLNTDAAVGFAVYDFSKGANVAATSSIIPIAGQGATCWSNFSPKTGTFFLTDIITSTVTEVKVDDKLVGSIVKQYPLAAGSGTIDNAIATINGNDFLYVLSANATSIDVMSLAAAGQATKLQTVNFAPLADKAGLLVNPIDLQGMAVFTS
jgi:6-phosphogluconolactonase (cycloisomerase 2 family)/LysM repeat protein